MKENIIIALGVLILGTMCLQLSTQKVKNRYEVVSSNNMLTILVDKQTGNTWRNCICSEQSPIPGCWEKMATINPEEFNKPVGEVKANRKMLALQKKQLKAKQKMEEKAQKAQKAE